MSVVQVWQLAMQPGRQVHCFATGVGIHLQQSASFCTSAKVAVTSPFIHCSTTSVHVTVALDHHDALMKRRASSCWLQASCCM